MATPHEPTEALVVAVSLDDRHRFSKTPVGVITLIQGLGILGDAHAGERVQHRSRVRADPDQPNLRQVHLIHQELLDDLRAKGFTVGPADLGENITTVGVDLLGLPRGARLMIGGSAEIEVTGLRNPCSQIESFQPGLLKEVVHRAEDGSVVRLTGVMGIVRSSGDIRPGDAIHVVLPEGSREPLEQV
ncbi:MOSC domain-containing protein [Tessaracoccus sp.]